MEYKFHEGQEVFAIDAKKNIIKTTVKEITGDQYLPYELDRPEKNRFYAESDLFNTREEAERAAIRGVQAGDTFDRQIDADFDKATNTFLGISGKRISKYFELTSEQMYEVEKRVENLMSYCRENDIPIHMLICCKLKATGDTQIMNAASLPGPRTPSSMALVKEVVARYQSLQKKGLLD